MLILRNSMSEAFIFSREGKKTNCIEEGLTGGGASNIPLKLHSLRAIRFSLEHVPSCHSLLWAYQISKAQVAN